MTIGDLFDTSDIGPQHADSARVWIMRLTVLKASLGNFLRIIQDTRRFHTFVHSIHYQLEFQQLPLSNLRTDMKKRCFSSEMSSKTRKSVKSLYFTLLK